jgi:hypothetical protein
MIKDSEILRLIQERNEARAHRRQLVETTKQVIDNTEQLLKENARLTEEFEALKYLSETEQLQGDDFYALFGDDEKGIWVKARRFEPKYLYFKTYAEAAAHVRDK